MNSSGIKRGLAATAVSALAVAGLPFLASSASADTIATQADTVLGDPSQVMITSPRTLFSDVNDGTNSTVSLAAAGGHLVTSVQFRFSTDGGTTWTEIGAPVSRNVDGLFTSEWDPAASLDGASITIQAVPNTGLAFDSTFLTTYDKTADTVELTSGGGLGVFQGYATPVDFDGAGPNPAEDLSGDYIALHGTTSQVNGSVGIYAAWQGAGDFLGIDELDGTSDGVSVYTATNTSETGLFDGVLDITAGNASSYPYSGGEEANQILLGAQGESDDSEAATLYIQSVDHITANPASVVVPNGNATASTLTVTDQNNQPIANATVGRFVTDTAPGTPGDQPGPSELVGATDANGEVAESFSDTSDVNYTYYANKTDAQTYTAGDPTVAVSVDAYSAAVTHVTITSDKGRTTFDPDEIDDNADFFVTTTDQNNKAIATSVEYRWTFDPVLPGDNVVGPWASAGSTTLPSGKVTIPSPTWMGPGQYTLDARHPNVGGTGLVNATPVTYIIADSTLVWADGSDANAPVNGQVTLTGNLGIVGGPVALPLAGRTVNVTWTTGGDSHFVVTAQQPAGTVSSGGTTATAVTDANGNFSVTLTDPTVPPNVTPVNETGTLAATAPDPAETASVNVHFAKAVTATAVDVTTNGNAKPGSPVNVVVKVRGDVNGDGTTGPTEYLTDVPVTIAVDHGFVTDGKPAATPVVGATAGYYKNLGTSATTSTGDAGTSANNLGATIERDPGFDDDGLVSETVTVTAGGMTKTVPLVFASDNPLNPGAVNVVPVGGDPVSTAAIGDEVKYNVFVHDQFGNLVGGAGFNTIDNGPADFTSDGLSDFTFDSASIVATSTDETVQTLTARWQTNTFVYTTTTGDGSPTFGGVTTVVGSSDPLTWTAAPPKLNPELKLSNKSANGKDKVKADAINEAEGATATLWVNGKKKATGTLNSSGNFVFKVKDTNGKNKTKYTVKITETDLTKKAQATASFK